MSLGFSFVMCTFNGERFVKEALDSLLKTNYTNFEIVVVDDGSHDDTPLILKAFASKKLIRLILQENRGLGDARNRALSFCRFPWIATLDQDDLSYRERLKKYEKIIQRDPDIGLVHSFSDLIDESGGIIQKEFACWKYPSGKLSGPEARQNLVSRGCFPGSAYAVNIGILNSIKGWDPTMTVSCDYDLFLRASETTNFSCTHSTDYAWRTHSQNTQNISWKRYREYRRTLLKVYNTPNLPKKLKKTIFLKVTKTLFSEIKILKNPIRNLVDRLFRAARRLKIGGVLFLCKRKYLHFLYYLLSTPLMLSWSKKGCRGPVPPIIKRILIQKVIKENKAEHFVETGTYFGHTTAFIWACSKVSIKSIELDGKLFAQARRKFRSIPRISLFLGDSGNLLQKKTFHKKKTVYWLDGHFSGKGTAHGKKSTPIMEELQAILKHNPAPIILIDDLNETFKKESGYPSVEEAFSEFSLSNNFKISTSCNILLLIPKT